tara:strand:+ start:197 stop:433 length:237 start_codon:yes stop_codon:yes gene_type:complete
LNCETIALDKELWDMMPILTAIICRKIVITIDSKRAQSSVKPNFDPAIVHIVTVPGPIKAAAITDPGPIFFKYFLILT